jgi:sulfur relay (sulfurtransferase) complex TusBCD TusD component (DsrE family)
VRENDATLRGINVQVCENDAERRGINAQRRRNDAGRRETKKPTVGELFNAAK